MKILYKKDMPLLSRTRVAIEIEHPEKSTPSKAEMIKEIASLLKSPEDAIIIRHVYTKYGKTKTKVIVNVYKNAEDLKRIEGIKEKVKKEKAPEEAKAEPAKKVEGK